MYICSVNNIRHNHVNSFWKTTIIIHICRSDLKFNTVHHKVHGFQGVQIHFTINKFKIVLINMASGKFDVGMCFQLE